jgi:hypothetical protein
VKSHLAAQCRRCSTVTACQRSSRTAEASGLKTEPTLSEKPCGYGQAEAAGTVGQLERNGTQTGRQPYSQAEAVVASACLASGGGIRIS